MYEKDLLSYKRYLPKYKKDLLTYTKNLQVDTANSYDKVSQKKQNFHGKFSNNIEDGEE